MAKSKTGFVWRVSALNSDGPWSVVVIAETPIEAFNIATKAHPWEITQGLTICAEEALFSAPDQPHPNT